VMMALMRGPALSIDLMRARYACVSALDVVFPEAIAFWRSGIEASTTSNAARAGLTSRTAAASRTAEENRAGMKGLRLWRCLWRARRQRIRADVDRAGRYLVPLILAVTTTIDECAESLAVCAQQLER